MSSDASIKDPKEPVEIPTTGKGQVEFRDVSFRYGEGEAWILKNVNITITSSEMVVLIGPSGGGKTTFILLAMGLILPTTGFVLVNGQPIHQIGLREWRRRIGSVLQKDKLFAGTLIENIASFRDVVDPARVRDVCQKVAILDEIEKTPLGLDTLVGDMGSSLSEGQLQRIMLARALYANPVAMFIDEGTSNVDHQAETTIVQTIRGAPGTRIVSAHRPAAAAVADRVFLVRDGAVRVVKALSASRPLSEGEEITDTAVVV